MAIVGAGIPIARIRRISCYKRVPRPNHVVNQRPAELALLISNRTMPLLCVTVVTKCAGNSRREECSMPVYPHGDATLLIQTRFAGFTKITAVRIRAENPRYE